MQVKITLRYKSVKLSPPLKVTRYRNWHGCWRKRGYPSVVQVTEWAAFPAPEGSLGWKQLKAAWDVCTITICLLLIIVKYNNYTLVMSINTKILLVSSIRMNLSRRKIIKNQSFLFYNILEKAFICKKKQKKWRRKQVMIDMYLSIKLFDISYKTRVCWVSTFRKSII